jgi:hypothetical protein
MISVLVKFVKYPNLIIKYLTKIPNWGWVLAVFLYLIAFYLFRDAFCRTLTLG